MKNNLQSGFVGVLVLFLVVAGMIFFIVRTEVFTGNKEGKSILEVNTSAIQQAKDVKIQLERNGVYTSEELND